MTVNTYSRTWFDLFLETQEFTEAEVAFVERQLPNPPYRTVLDLCCGHGRHANLLAARGYRVVGVDRDEAALERARRLSAGDVRYRQLDMRRLSLLPGHFDAVLSLWQSFGYFDEATNRDVLRQISQKLREKGRFFLDIYNRDFWEHSQGVRHVERKGISVIITNTMQGNRLQAALRYSNGAADAFEWQLYNPDEICRLTEAYDLHCIGRYAWYDEQKAVTAEQARVQLLMEKRGSQVRYG